MPRSLPPNAATRRSRRAAGSGSDSVKLRTRPAAEADDGTLLPLRAAFAAGLDDPTLAAALLGEFDVLRRKLPAPAQDGLDLPQDAAALRALAEDAWQVAAAAIAEAERA